MKKKQGITAFYMEMLMLIAVFIVVILVLTRVFAVSKQQSTAARVLTNAVCLAENAAEMVSASDSWETLTALLGRAGNARELESEEGKLIQARYDSDMQAAPEGSYRVDVLWVSDRDGQNELVQSVIKVYWNGEETPVYSLETAVCLP